LDKVLSSRAFVGNDRQSKFLRFVVEQHLEGKAGELKESLLGIQVFGRTPGFDPRQDSVVRTEAVRLRVRLSQYYAGEGAGDPVVIELPKGGYTPVFRQPQSVADTAVQGFNGAPSWLGMRLRLTTTLAGIALLLAVSGWWWATHKSASIPIAVLPLTNLSADPANDYFADGLTYEIIRNLSLIEGLAVRSQTSSFALEGKPRNIREAGKQLDAEYILEGSVQRAGQQLRINVQLVRVRDDIPVWSGKFDEESTDVFAIQDKVSLGIVNYLRLELGRGRRRYEASPEAYDLYLRARALQLQNGQPGLDRSIGPLEEAIAKDPSFAPAYAALAMAYASRSGQFRLEIPDEVQKLRAAVEQAIRLDPLLAEAHDVLGRLHARDARWVESEMSFRHAIELDPGSSASRTGFANYLLRSLGRGDEALQQLRIAEKNDPLSPQIHFNLGWLLISTGRLDEAAGYCSKLPPDYPSRNMCLGRALIGQGRTEEAIRSFIKSGDRGERGYLGYAYARSGRREEAEKLAIDLSPRPIQQAVIFAGVGDKDRTFEALDRAAVVGPVRMGSILSLPELALLRGDPRLQALRKKVGLP
jgi:TolB-like protein/Tfp pilus assembly protein PilF